MLASPCCRPTVVRLAAYTALLFLSWNHNLLRLPEHMGWVREEVRVGSLGLEADLVLGRAGRADLPAFYPLGFPHADGSFQPYQSQVGPAGILLAALPFPPGQLVPVATAGAALFAAAVLAAVLVGGQRWVGPPAGDVACALAAASPVFVPFAPSLYWALGLTLLPFALVWCLGSRATTPARMAMLTAGVGAAVFARCLCGYEYVTTVVLAPAAAAWFHLHRAAAPMGRRLAVAGVLIAAGLVGFAAALGAHVAQLELVVGTDGVAAIRDRATARTLTDHAPEATAGGGSRLVVAARCFWGFFGQPAVSLPRGIGRAGVDVPLKWVAAAALALAAAAGLARDRLPRGVTGLAAAVPLALLAGVSWQVLAVNHMCVHDHLNLVVFAVPFLPLGYLAVGTAAGMVVGPRVGPLALAVVAVVMGANLATYPARTSAAVADQRAAETAVADALAGGRPVAARADGAVDSSVPAAGVPRPVLADFGWLDPATGLAADPGAVVARGWAGGDRRPPRVVAVVGDRVVACDQIRFRRGDVESALGRAAPGAGFAVRVPSVVLSPGRPLRLFVASPDGAVAELPALTAAGR